MQVASAYGFTSPAITLSRRAIADQGDVDHHTAAVMALLSATPAGLPAQAGGKPHEMTEAISRGKPAQSWGLTKKGGGTTLTFSVTSGRHSLSHALVVKTALSIAELSGFEECQVMVSSVGDGESRRRFTRELTSFFKRNSDALSGDTKESATKDPDAAYRALLASDDSLRERLPRPIDYLSENSRKVMMDTLALFESVGIAYTLAPHLPSAPGIESELLFAVTGMQKGVRSVVAEGGRFDEFANKKIGATAAVGIAVTVPQEVELDEEFEQAQCYVVHVGEAAKLKAFTLLEALWRARVSVRQALLAETLREQMERAKMLGVPYIAIIGQREALDNTVIVRSSTSQMQASVTVDKLIQSINRSRK